MLVAPFRENAADLAISELNKLLLSARNPARASHTCRVRHSLFDRGVFAKGENRWCLLLAKRGVPVIALSTRYNRIDNFWFVLRHELEHVKQRHGTEKVMIDVELEGEKAGVTETVADEERREYRRRQLLRPSEMMMHSSGRRRRCFLSATLLVFRGPSRFTPVLWPVSFNTKRRTIGDFAAILCRSDQSLPRARLLMAGETSIQSKRTKPNGQDSRNAAANACIPR